MPEIMVSAGEVSGDRYAALLAGRLREMDSVIKFWGIGGAELSKAGVEIVSNTVEKSVMGFTEPLKRICFYISLLKAVKREIKERKPDLLLLVDFTAFNMKLAKYGYEEGIPVVSFFSPSVWCWGVWRAAQMARWKVKIAAVLPMEYNAYKQAGADVCFVGHPLPELIKNRDKRLDLREHMKDSGYSRIIGILPGSREMEVRNLLAEFLKAAEVIFKKHSDCLFVLPVAAPHLKGLVENIAAQARTQIPLLVVDGRACDVIESSEFVITAGGTATLEAACLGTPLLAAYKVSPVTGFLARLLTRVKYFALPNIILGEQAVPEFFQKRAKGKWIGETALKLMENSAHMEKMKSRLAGAAQMLGDGKAVDRTAGIILDVLADRSA